MAGREDEPADLVTLRDLYPSWTFGCERATTAAGLGERCLWARRGNLYFTADSAGGLVSWIERARNIPGSG